MKRVSKTAPEVIRAAAALIAQKGFAAMGGLNLSTAITWAVHGSPCRPRDLRSLEAEHVAEALDVLEEGLKMPLITYERQRAGAIAWRVCEDLRRVARDVDVQLGLVR